MRLLLLFPLLLVAACLDWPEELLIPGDGPGMEPDVQKTDGPVKDRAADRAMDKAPPPADKAADRAVDKAPPPTDQAADKATPPTDQAVPPKDQAVPPKDQAVPPKDQAVPPKDQAVPPKDQAVPPKDQAVPPKDSAPPTLKNNGQPCGSPGECFSGQCADGVCCDRACTPACHSCNATGKQGQCVPVAFGDKPPAGKSCPAAPPDSCGTDGTCDGAGTCKSWSGTVCKKAECDKTLDNQVLLSWTCDGKGTCANLQSSTKAIDCKTYACQSGLKGCNVDCKNNNQCTSTSSCVGGKCDGKALPMGATCSSAGQCESGHCVEGVCCDSDCKAPCKTCTQEGATGRCAPISRGNIPPTGKACALNLPCGEDGRCDGAGKCREAPAGTLCGTPACALDKTGHVFKTFACDGAGKCQETLTPCGNYACQPGNKSCYGRCTSSGQCTSPRVCVAQQCK